MNNKRCIIKNYCSKIWRIQIMIIFLAGFFISANTEDCGQEEWTQCSRPLEVLTATSELSFVSKKEELDKLCPDLHVGLNCIRSYTRRCMNIHQREHFNKLYNGTSQVIHEICEEGPYQEEFLRHAPCMRHVKKEYEICSNQYQETITKIGQSASKTHPSHNKTQMVLEEEARRREMCCSFKEYIECSERVVKHACGHSTANFTRRFLDKMSSSIMSMHCDDYRGKTKKCGPFSSGSKIFYNLVSSALILSFTIFLIYF